MSVKNRLKINSEPRELYPDECTEYIFKRVFNSEIGDEDLKNNLIVIFDVLTDKNKKFLSKKCVRLHK